MHKHRTLQEKQEIINEFIESGKTRRSFCIERNISATALGDWLKNEKITPNHKATSI